MIYTETEKKELDEVRMVFAEHLQQCPDYELLWSDKVGYVWLAIGWSRSMWIPAAGSSRRKTSAGSAWRASEWTPYISPTTTTGWKNADPLERAEIRRRWKPFMDQLPQFAYLCGEILPQKD